MALLIGPFVAAVGLVAVFFVMRHRSVQTKSMYSSRRAQIERKVRAARQRTLAPTGKSAESAQAPQTFVGAGMEAKTAIPTATWGAPTVGPAPAAPPAPEPVWEVGPTTPAPSVPPPPAAPEPSPPTFGPTAPQQEVWTPAPVEPFEPVAPPKPEPVAAPVEIPAGAGASWSIVSEDSKDVTQEAVTGTGKKRKKDKKEQTGSWQLASGEAPGDEYPDEIRGPSSAVAVAQYAVLVVGLVMVLIGVLVMVANSHAT